MKYIELLNGIEDGWSIKEKARYLYRNICQNMSYDERFAYSQNKELLHEIYNREVDIREDEDTRLICHTSNKVYYQLLSELGIKAKIIYKKPAVQRPIDVNDVALVFWDEEKNRYYTNIIIANEVKNTNNFKNFLKAQGIDTSNMSKDDILKNKMFYLTSLIKFRDKTAGPDEMKKFYKHLFSASVLDKFESKKFNTFEYIKENKEEIDVLSVLEIDLREMPIYYVYSEEEQAYVQLLSEEVLQKIDGYRERKGKKLLIEDKEITAYDGEEH